MPFLRAVFCLKGVDNRSRFFVISIVTLFSFILLSAVFSAYLSVNLIILLGLSLVLACSTKRRLRDAKLNKNWQLVPAALFLVAGLLSLVIESSGSYYLLILPLLSSALLLTYPSKNNQVNNHYILGYCGPIDLSQYGHQPSSTQAHKRRIEPTLVGNTNKTTDEPLIINEKTTINSSGNRQSDNDARQTDVGEVIRLHFLSNRKLQLATIVCVVIILIMIFASTLVDSINPQQNENTLPSSEQQVNTATQVNTMTLSKEHLLAMPDSFNLYLSAYQGVIIHWQADEVANGELWSQLTAKGDKSCQLIKFNKGTPLRPLAVIVENGNEYFASFSPLDSKELVQALAFRGKFSLCGYSFSLKGSQAALGKHQQYAKFLEKDA
ncbi:hypothetical protein AADZ84_01765 [Colwelliaceae bacterium MEBiC 14330]